MTTRLLVCFNPDDDGAGPDLRIIVNVPSEACLFCCCDNGRRNRFYEEIEKAVAAQGYRLAHLFKIYTV